MNFMNTPAIGLFHQMERVASVAADMDFKMHLSIKRKLFKLGIMAYVLMIATTLHAQDDLETAPRDINAKEKIQSLRTAYISEKLALTPEQAEKFWPIYRAFIKEKLTLRQQLRSAQKEQDINNTDTAAQQRLVNLALEIKQKELNLEKVYSDRLLKVISAHQILTLPKAEVEFRQIIINQLQKRRLQPQGDLDENQPQQNN
jgi:hypothetical protein